ncbi:MAG TPA: carbamoyltransferase HypF [Methylococcaceae bacterium]|nr:carbamoyltransferase HypF [Methylococcaceae bacterium]
MNPPAQKIARLLSVKGRVQGVGFRPFVSRLAHGFGLTGWVRNVAGQVEIFVQGTAECLAAFERALVERAPPLARPQPPIGRPADCVSLDAFSIDASESGDVRHAHIPPDHFICDDCLAEMRDPSQRRYRYPFINCTQCGPRYTLIERLPYDRPHTAMAGFPLCEPCRREYEDPLDRRFHAQPLACPVCGPSLRFRRAGQADVSDTEQAIAACIEALRQGLIVAVKGVGGYHLLCDATSEAAVLRLRERKRRPHKPLAVMLPWLGADGLDAAREHFQAGEAELALLQDPLRPIVLASGRASGPLAESIAPGMREVGLMLPYSPLHHLLLEGFGGAVVATSANLSGEPVLTEADEVEARLGPVADAFLHHDRPILRPADDAVFRFIAGKARPLRLGRGCAPLEIDLPFRLARPLLAVGGQMKDTVALAWDERAVISPHIGDLGSRRSQEVFEQVIADLTSLYGVEPQQVVCDAHPDYSSTRWAKNGGLPIVKVFHHHAHASSLAGEFGRPGAMLVFTWDGSGYGEDGGLWGGEGLLGEPGRWRRVSSIRSFRLPGGDKAGREPWRSALALCWEAGVNWPACAKETRFLEQAWRKRINCPDSSSAGRLFDAAAALVGIASEVSFEAQAPMWLEASSRPGETAVELPLSRDASGIWRTDWAPLLPMLLNENLSVSERGGRFHASLALALSEQAENVRREFGVTRVGLSGGVFQNRLLTERAVELLSARGFSVFLNERIPANDAGLSFGQLIEASASRTPPQGRSR